MVIEKQFSDFISKKSIINNRQYGFIKNKGTIDALTHCSSFVRNNLNNNSLIGAISIDLKKAFDSIKHDILFNKFIQAGIMEDALSLLKSYMTGRKEFIQINKSLSDPKTISQGIPQGAALSSIFFNIYINDIFETIDVQKDITEIILYADDVLLLYASKDVKNIIDNLTKMFSDINSWCDRNRLQINIGKCHFTIFASKQNTKKIEKSICINLDGNVLKYEDNIKYLGMYFDNVFLFDKQVKYLKKRLNYWTMIIYKVRKYLPGELKRKLYYSQIQSMLMYGIDIWGTTRNYVMDSIYVQQKKIIKILYNYRIETSSVYVFQSTKFLSIYKLLMYMVLIKMYKHINSLKTLVNLDLSYRFHGDMINFRDLNMKYVVKTPNFINFYGKIQLNRVYPIIWNRSLKEFFNAEETKIDNMKSISKFKNYIKSCLLSIDHSRSKMYWL